MNTIANTLLASSLCLLVALPAQAGRYRDEVGLDDHLLDRVERQQQRIARGIRSGELTRGELGKLRQQKRKTRTLARQFGEDDVLTKKERRVLNRRLDRTSKHIWALKHNARDRDSGWHGYRDDDRNHGRGAYRNHHSGGKHHHRHNRHHHGSGHRDVDFHDWFGDGSWTRYGLLFW